MNILSKALALTSCSALLFTGAQAAIEIDVYVSADDGFYYQPNSIVPVDSTYELTVGIINGFTFAEYVAMTPQEQADAMVTAYNTFVAVTAPTAFDNNGEMTLNPAYLGPRPAEVGAQLYTLVQNALGEIGIFTVDEEFWQIGNDSDSTPLSQLFLEVGTPVAIIGSVDGINGVLAAQVPEPSTYAFMAGLMTLGLVAYRRRRA